MPANVSKLRAAAIPAVIVAGCLGISALALQVGAQTSSKSGSSTTTRTTYSARTLNEIKPTAAGDAIIEVIPLKDSPAFLVRTKKAINVWVREEYGITLLLEIAVDATFKNVVLLEDSRTFAVHSTGSVRVYSVETLVEEIKIK